MTALRGDDGEWIDDQEPQSHIETSFKDLFSESEGEWEQVVKVVTSKIDGRANKTLLKPLSTEEIKIAVL